MKSLAESNPYLRNKEIREQMIEEDVLQSSAFEGVRLWERDETHTARRRMASSKKAPSGSTSNGLSRSKP